MPVPQLSFDYLLPAKDWLDLDETAKAIGMQRRFTQYAIEDGQIGSHEHNSKIAAAKRMTQRVPKWWVQGYLVKTATYDAPMKLQHAGSVLDAFKGSRADLIQLRQHIDRLLTH